MVKFSVRLNERTHYETSPTNDFQIYWNVPTFMCHKYGINFTGELKDFGIVQNKNDEFRGDKIAILYDPGYFPALLKGKKGNQLRRNGGVPQEGNLKLHLKYFRQHLSEQIPDKKFSGLAVIDFESWRPIFRQNWASLEVYRELSVDIERHRHPGYPSNKLYQVASERFEKYGRVFMNATLKLAQKLRPNADWGYYAYPYCFNWSPQQQSSQCSTKVMFENDRMKWLFESANVLFPSVYLPQRLSIQQRVGLVRGRIQEAVRLAKIPHDKPPAKVFAYFWYKYQDQRETFISKDDILSSFKEIAKGEADGLIIWGSSDDLSSEEKCTTFLDYLVETLGPTIAQFRNQFEAA